MVFGRLSQKRAGVREACGKGTSLPWIPGCGAGRTGVAAARVTAIHAGSHSGVWLWLAQGSAALQPPARAQSRAARPPPWTRGPVLPGAQQKTAAGSGL